jgi:hypothetical protein
MKLFNLRVFVLIFSLLSCALAAHSQNYPPYPTPGTSPIYYGIYPVNVEVPYGKTTDNPEIIQLTYYIVNQTKNTYILSDFSLQAVNAPNPNPISFGKPGYQTNCDKKLGPANGHGGNTCTITVNLKAANNGGAPITYDFRFAYTGASKAVQHAPQFNISFANGQVITSAARTFTFVNNCDQDIYFGIDSGAAPAIKPDPSIQPADPQSCIQDSDCYPGSSCVQVQALPTVLKHCFWANPAPANSLYKLNGTSGSAPHSNTVDFPVYDNGINISWNGGIAARVGCDETGDTACTIADCGVDPVTGFTDGACPVPGGFATPSTLAEFSLLTQNPIVTSTSGTPTVDTYDITIINGVTVPTSMEPTTAAWGGQNKPYTCGKPGAVTASAPLGDCQWFGVSPPTDSTALPEDFIWVDVGGGGGSCPGTCTTPGEVCGHTAVGTTVSSSLVCGEKLGYFTADAVCAIDKNFGSPFNCADTVYENGTHYTMTEIYGCSSGDFKNSCYSVGATDACCGCQNWYTTAPMPPAPITQSCGKISNTNWQNALIKTKFLPWLKRVCPTAYVFPFDDASSTFTCSDINADNNNVVDYTITFCPAS